MSMRPANDSKFRRRLLVGAAAVLALTNAHAGDGYLLLAPLRSTSTYLVSRDGRTVHEWRSDATPGMSARLLDNGNLLRCESVAGAGFEGGGGGGRVREYDWNGKVVWEYVCADADRRQHHDVERLPNGNVLLIAWERRTKAETLNAGRDPVKLEAGELWPDVLLEVRPTLPRGGDIVWEWRAWDHLVQSFDPSLSNYGRAADHPQRIDINAGARNSGWRRRESEVNRRLRELGYFGADEPPSASERALCADWSHCNSVDYSAELDLIVLSSREFSELWFIDHSTTPEQARGSSGGRWGRGGDLVFRWGNPSTWGGPGERVLFHQHDAHWIPPSLPGGGNLLLFNNGGADARPWSNVVELALRFDPPSERGTGRVAARVHTEIIGSWRTREFCGFLSGAERLPSGGLLICSGESGSVYELDPDGTVARELRIPAEIAAACAAGPEPANWKSTSAVFRVPFYAEDHPALAASRRATQFER